MRTFKFIIHFILLLTTPSFFVYPQDIAIQTIPSEEDPLTYNEILHFIHEIESGDLEKRYGSDNLDSVNRFLGRLAQEGTLTNDPQIRLALNHDIGELLHLDLNGANQASIFLCRSWIEKKWNQTKRFIKNHKKALIIGAAIVVASVVVYGVAAAVCAAAAARSEGREACKHNQFKPKDTPKSPPPENSESQMQPTSEALQSSVHEHLSLLKDTLVKERLFDSTDAFFAENGRTVGSLLAHDCLNTVNPHSELGHQKIDRAFATDYTSLYSNPSKEANFTTLSHQMRGEKALAHGYFHQAAESFDRAIQLEPTNSLPYLQRGVAHFELGQYQNSIDDYRVFTSQTQAVPLSVTDFSIGFARGLHKGAYDSAEGMLLFLADFAIHPVQTSKQVYEAVSALSSLVLSEDWDTLSKALAPEVHQLVTEWETLPSEKRGELAGYAFGKYGMDIVMPGAITKVASTGIKGTQKLVSICKNLEMAESILVLETFAAAENGASIAEAMHVNKQVISSAENLGYKTKEITELKHLGELENTISEKLKHIAHDPELVASYQLFEKAETFLKPYRNANLSELEVRNLIHQTGIPTFPRPEGIPDHYLVKISKKGAGIRYIDPSNPNTMIRVMPGKIHSEFTSQQTPYVTQQINGKFYDKFGNIILKTAAEAHIPIGEFNFRK